VGVTAPVKWLIYIIGSRCRLGYRGRVHLWCWVVVNHVMSHHQPLQTCFQLGCCSREVGAYAADRPTALWRHCIRDARYTKIQPSGGIV